jgi:hypothetical protein
MRTLMLGLIGVAALGAAACSGGPSRPNSAVSPEDPAVVYFENKSTEQAAVYAVAGGESRRIGTVFAGQLAKLRVPATMVARGSINIFARLLARNELPQSGAISIRPGSSFEVTLMPDRRTMMVLPGVPDPDR